MLPKEHTSNKLRLAILTAILSSIHTSALATQDWKCKSINGQWDCSSPVDSSVDTITSEIDGDDIESNIYAQPPQRSISDAPLTPNVKNTQLQSEPVLNTQRQSNLSEQPTLVNNASKAPQKLAEKAPISASHLGTSTPLKPSQNTQVKKSDPGASNTNLSKNTNQNGTTDNVLRTDPIDSELAQVNPLSAQEIYESHVQQYSNVEQTSIDSKTLDWYPYTSQSERPGLCKGRYISPKIGDTSEEQTISSLQKVFISADQSATELGKTSTLTGNVDIQQGNKSLHSPIANLNQETGAFSLEDGVTFRQTGLLISGKRAEGNINEEETRLYDSKYVLHEAGIRGEAGVIVRKTNDLLDIKEGSLTFCPPEDESWKILADEINLDTKAGFGRAKHAKFTVLGTPVFYFPVFYFPLDDRRKSGFLFPSIKLSSTDSKLTIPYYFNIAANMDDTLTTTLFSKRGVLLENEFRYLDKNSLNRLSTTFIDDTKLKEDRWSLGLNHKGNYGNFDTVVDYTKVSDNDYFTDLGTNLDIDEGTNDHLNQTAKVSYSADTWNSSVLLQKYQTIDDLTTKPYQRLPEIRISGTPKEDLENIDLNYRAVFTRFDRDQTGLTGSDRVIGDRLILNPSINSEYRSVWGYVKPSLKLWQASYNLQDQVAGVDSNQSATVPILEVDSGLFFDREFSFQDKGYTQTLEPRLYALYVPYVDQSELPDFDTSELTFTYDSLFRNNRFSGDDRFGDAKQISLGLTSRVISDQGREIISASIGHAFYFNDRKVRIDPNAAPLKDDTSDFATSVTWRPNKRLRVLFDAAFDADSFNNSEMTLDLKYEADPNHVVGLRHRFTQDIRKQTTLSHLWPISPTWSTLGLVQYDWLTNETIDVAAGLEYQSCCWKTRVVIRNELKTNNKRDNSIALQFVLRGLGGIGDSPTKALRDKIKGYDNREYYNANN